MRTNVLSAGDLADCYPLPVPGVYVDVSIPADGQGTIGFGIRREGWIGVKTFSVPTRQREAWLGEIEAVRLAKLWFLGEQIWCDHPHVARAEDVGWLDRRQNRWAHRAARKRENWLNENKDSELPHHRRLMAYARTVQPCVSSVLFGEAEGDQRDGLRERSGKDNGRWYYSSRLGTWVRRGRLHGR